VSSPIKKPIVNAADRQMARANSTGPLPLEAACKKQSWRFGAPIGSESVENQTRPGLLQSQLGLTFFKKVRGGKTERKENPFLMN